MSSKGPHDDIPDVRDGLTRVERLVLYVMHQAKAEFGERYIPTALLYGRVVEYVDIDSGHWPMVRSSWPGGRSSCSTPSSSAASPRR